MENTLNKRLEGIRLTGAKLLGTNLRFNRCDLMAYTYEGSEIAKAQGGHHHSGEEMMQSRAEMMVGFMTLGIPASSMEQKEKPEAKEHTLDLSGCYLVPFTRTSFAYLESISLASLEMLAKRAVEAGVCTIYIVSQALNSVAMFDLLGLFNTTSSVQMLGVIEPKTNPADSKSKLSDISRLKSAGGAAIATYSSLSSNEAALLHNYSKLLGIPLLANTYEPSLGGDCEERSMLGFEMGFYEMRGYANSLEIARMRVLQEDIGSTLALTHMHSLSARAFKGMDARSFIDIAYLLFDERYMQDYNAMAKTYPPLLKDDSARALLEALLEDPRALITPSFYKETNKALPYFEAAAGIDTLSNYYLLLYGLLLERIGFSEANLAKLIAKSTSELTPSASLGNPPHENDLRASYSIDALDQDFLVLDFSAKSTLRGSLLSCEVPLRCKGYIVDGIFYHE